MDERHHLILYDGVCGLCARLTQFVLPRDPKGVFRYASLQSDIGRAFLVRFGKNPDDLDTLVVITDYETDRARALTKSNAGLFVMENLGGLWKTGSLVRVLPQALRDWGYGIIARYRYDWFGKHEACWLPTPENRGRFLDL